MKDDPTYITDSKLKRLTVLRHFFQKTQIQGAHYWLIFGIEGELILIKHCGLQTHTRIFSFSGMDT